MGKRKSSINILRNKRILAVLFILIFASVAVFFLAFPQNEEICEENPCRECKVVASCIEYESEYNHTYLSFDIKNQNILKGVCSVYVSVEDSKKEYSKNITLGDILPGMKVRKKVFVATNESETSFKIIPSCVWG